MINKYAKKEYNDIKKFLPYLKKIPNYEDYFLVEGVSICKPENLNEDDLYDFDEKCKNLVKKDFYETNINEEKKLSMLSSVNMPYGGIDVGDYIDSSTINGYLDYKKLLNINNQLLNLLKNGILPMNNEHIYHCDLKESNILIDKQNNLRIIDWGISCKYDGESYVPEVLQRRTLQYNIPFSNILFNGDFYKSYKKFLNGKKEKTKLEIRDFVIEFLFFWIKARGPGHLKGINNIVTLLFEENLNKIDEELKDQIIEFNYTFNFIIEYITKILMTFTKNGEFDKIAYLNIFLKNVDIWGFAISYMAIVEIIKKSKKMTKNNEKIIEKIKELIVFLYESSDIEINVNKLISILEELNPILRSSLSDKLNISSSKTDELLISPLSSSSHSLNSTFSNKLKTTLREKVKSFINKSAKGLTKKNKKKHEKKHDSNHKKDKKDKKDKKKFSLIRTLYNMRNKK